MKQARPAASASPRTPAKKKRRRWLWSLLTGPLLLGVFLLAATCKPSWYQPAAIDYSRIEDDRREVVNITDEIGAALNQGSAIDLVFTQDQLNRWLAARREIPGLDQFDLQGADRPHVSLLGDNRIRLAVTVHAAGAAGVASVILKPRLEGDSLILAWDGLQLGLVPTPRSLVTSQLAKKLPEEVRSHLDEREGSIRIPNEWTWGNGKRPFRATQLRIEPGALRVRLEPR